MARLVGAQTAGDKDIRIGGGADVIRQYLQAGFIDELHVGVAPILAAWPPKR